MQYAKADTKVIGTLGLMMKRNHCAIMKKFFVAREYTYPDRDSLLYQLDLE